MLSRKNIAINYKENKPLDKPLQKPFTTIIKQIFVKLNAMNLREKNEQTQMKPTCFK